MPFRVFSTTLFLTYSRCAIDKVLIHSHIENVLQFRKHHWVTAHEFHEDGGDHLHVFISLTRKWDIRNERLFDFTCEAGRVYHPSIEAPRTPWRALQYTKKDGDWLETGTPHSRLLPRAEESGSDDGGTCLGKRDRKVGGRG